MAKQRKTNKKLLELIEDGTLDMEVVLKACLNYMSESDVLDMATDNEFLDDVIEHNDDVDDNDDDDDESEEIEF
jgi:hypothetical protein